MSQSFPPAVADELQRLLDAVESKEEAIAALARAAAGQVSDAARHANSASASAEAAADIVAAYVENLDAQRLYSLPAGGPSHPERVYIYMPAGVHVHYDVDDGQWYDAMGGPASEIDDPAPGVRVAIEDMELDYDETITIKAEDYFGGGVLRFKGSAANGSVAIREERGTLFVHGEAEGGGTVTPRVVDGKGRAAQQTFVVMVGKSNNAPRASGPIGALILTPESEPKTFDLNEIFSDREGDDLTFSVRTSDASVVEASVSGSTLTVSAVGIGEATVTPVADDGEFETESAFDVKVEGSLSQSGNIPDQTMQAGGQVTLRASDYWSGTGLAWDGSTSDQAGVTLSEDGDTLTIESAQAGSARIMARVTDGSGNADSQVFDLGVFAAGDLSAAFAVSRDDLLATFDATDSAGDIASAQWQFGDGASATGVVVEHEYASAGLYDVTLQVEDASGATASTTTTITVGQGVTLAAIRPAAQPGENREISAMNFQQSRLAMDFVNGALQLYPAGMIPERDVPAESGTGSEAVLDFWPQASNVLGSYNFSTGNGASISRGDEAYGDGGAPGPAGEYEAAFLRTPIGNRLSTRGRILDLPPGGVLTIDPNVDTDGNAIVSSWLLRSAPGQGEQTITLLTTGTERPNERESHTIGENDYQKVSGSSAGTVAAGDGTYCQLRNETDQHQIYHLFDPMTFAGASSVSYASRVDLADGNWPQITTDQTLNGPTLPYTAPDGTTYQEATIYERWRDPETGAWSDEVRSYPQHGQPVIERAERGKHLSHYVVLAGQHDIATMRAQRSAGARVIEGVLRGDLAKVAEMTMCGDATIPLNILPNAFARIVDGKGYTIFSGASSNGANQVFLLEHSSAQVTGRLIAPDYSNDHGIPAVAIVESGHGIGAYMRHNGPRITIERTTATVDQGIAESQWEEVAVYEAGDELTDDTHSHPQFVVANRAPGGAKRWFLFWRGEGGISYVYSDDEGQTWSSVSRLIGPAGKNYVRYDTLHDGTINFINNSDKNPAADGPASSSSYDAVAYASWLPDGSFENASGDAVGTRSDGAASLSSAEVIYDAYDTRVLDMQQDAQGRQCAAFSAHRTAQDQRLMWKRLEADGTWTEEEVCEMGASTSTDPGQTLGACFQGAETLIVSREVGGEYRLWRYTRTSAGTWEGEREHPDAEREAGVEALRPRRVEGPAADKLVTYIYFLGIWNSYSSYSGALMGTGLR